MLIAETLGHPYLDAYLNSLATNFSYGANFATAGSTIRRPNTTIFQTRQSPFSLDVQFSQYSQFKSRSQVINKQGNNYDICRNNPYFRRIETSNIVVVKDIFIYVVDKL